MKNTSKIKSIRSMLIFAAVVAAGVGLMVTSAHATLLVQVDFGAVGGPGDNGTTTEGGTTWNGVEPGNSGSDLPAGGSSGPYSNLLDSDGNTTAIDLTLNWSNQSGLDFSRAWDLHPGDRDGDYIGIKGDNPGVFNVATFSDLSAGGTYNITVWTQAPTDFRVGGTEVEVIGSTNDSEVNAAASYTFTGVVADGSGEISVDWGHISTNRGVDQWATMTAMSIQFVVPEPSTVLLFCMGGWVLYAASQRFRRR